MHEIKVTQFHDHLCGWGEGLCWDRESGKIYFVDCMRNSIGVTTLEQPNDVHLIQTPSMPTKVLLSQKPGCALVVLEDGIYEIIDDKCGPTPLIPMPDGANARFNDATVDPSGRIVTGNLGLEANTEGSYWSWQAGIGWTQLAGGKGNANGPCFSEDGHVMYFSDSPTGNIHRYNYDQVKGRATEETVFANTFAFNGGPDGAAIDSEGYLWSAVYGGGVVARYAPDGQLNAEIPLPVRNPTDVSFVGADLDRLIVTSALERPDESEKTSALMGATFELSGTGVSGVSINQVVL